MSLGSEALPPRQEGLTLVQPDQKAPLPSLSMNSDSSLPPVSQSFLPRGPTKGSKVWGCLSSEFFPFYRFINLKGRQRAGAAARVVHWVCGLEVLQHAGHQSVGMAGKGGERCRVLVPTLPCL